MFIYTPYFYIIQEISTGIYYAGSKFGIGANPENFLKENGYITSSETIRLLIKKNGIKSFIVRKIRKFSNRIDAYNYETRFLNKIDARNNPNFYNKHNNNGIAFGTNDFTKIMFEKYGVINYTQQDHIKEKLKNTIMVRDISGKSFRVSNNDPRWLSGELVGVQKGRGGHKLSLETRIKISKNNVGFSGRKHTNLSNQKRSITLKNTCSKREPKICPHCNLIGNGGNMTRYHFDNCKSLIKP